MNLLVIDDDPDLLEMTSNRLRRKGAQSFPAKNLSEARVLLHQIENISAVVSDLFLQDGENGLDFYQEIRAQGFAFKFVLVTGDDFGDKRIVDYQLKDLNFKALQKPYSIDNLVQFLK